MSDDAATPAAQLREYDTVAHLISALSSMCAAEPNKVVDLLTGYLWDEEEAGNIKASPGLQATRISL